MSQHAETPQLSWSLSELLPTGTVTLLLADVEGSTRLWESQPEQMTAALALLNRTVNEAVMGCDGVRPLEQGEGDSFVAAFARASDAVACALVLQRAPLAPIRIRIGIHTGEIQLRDDANYAGPTINRAARIRDLAHGGQTVLSGASESMVADRLPDGAWLTELGSYPLRGVPRPERVLQLCHPDLGNEFPPLRVGIGIASQNLPAQLTSFIGREAQISELCQLVPDNRLVTLSGAGGAGKTRLAVEVASRLSDEFPEGIWYVDLAPVNDPVVVPVVLARTLNLPDQPGRPIMDAVSRFVRDRKMLLIIDNCEHLLDACGALVIGLLDSGPGVSILATSREPIGIPGELTWRVPSLSLDEEAIQLFVDRARRVRQDFRLTAENSAAVAEICRRLDGMPLAIELAAARVRTLSLGQIVDGLHNSFRVLTGGARTAVRRQQTLRASVDWSHAMLTDGERILFRRLAVFMGGFDLDAAHAVGASTDNEQFQLIDLLGLLVDKSLIVAEEVQGAMRYRMLEPMRQYGLEKLSESGEADDIRTWHRDHYVATAAALESQMRGDWTPLVPWADIEIDNLRAAYTWSREMGDFGPALQLASALQEFWLTRGRFREGLAAFDAVLTDKLDDGDVPRAVLVRAVADAVILAAWVSVPASLERAEKALAVARGLDDRALVIRSLMACSMLVIYDPGVAEAYLAEATELARASGDLSVLRQLRAYQTFAYCVAGDFVVAQATGEEGRDLADAQGDRLNSRYSRVFLASAMSMQGQRAEAVRIARSVVEESRTDEDRSMEALGLIILAQVLAYQGDHVGARTAAAAALECSSAMGGFHESSAHAVLALAALAGGDIPAAKNACDAAWRETIPLMEVIIRSMCPMAEVDMACGDLVAARRWADDAVAGVLGFNQALALTARARVALAQGEPEQAERDAHEALVIAARTRACLRVPTNLECLARVAADGSNHAHAARLLGAADGIGRRTGEGRYTIYQADYEFLCAAVREALGQSDFDAAWAEGAALSTEQAIAYAQRGRGARKRPSAGWGSLTPMELDVVRLVAEGLGNKDIGARLFISPRTVQTHLTHVYAKLGLRSRMQLAQEAARHA